MMTRAEELHAERDDLQAGLLVLAAEEHGAVIGVIEQRIAEIQAELDAMQPVGADAPGMISKQRVIDRLRKLQFDLENAAIGADTTTDDCVLASFAEAVEDFIAELTESSAASVQADAPDSSPRAKCDAEILDAIRTEIADLCAAAEAELKENVPLEVKLSEADALWNQAKGLEWAVNFIRDLEAK